MSKFKTFVLENKKLLLLQILIFLVSIILFLLPDSEESVFSKEGYVSRESYTGRDKEVTIDAQIGGIQVEDFSFLVSHREYAEEDLYSLFLESHDLILDHLSDNTGNGSYVSDLYFFSSLPDSPFSFSFYPMEEKLIDLNGNIMVPYSFSTQISVTASYGKYEFSDVISIKVEPSDEIQKRCIQKMVSDTIADIDSKTLCEEYVALPDEVDGVEICYKEKGKRKNPIIILCGIIFAIIIGFAFEYDRKKAVDNRKREILREYPLIIQKLVMYMSAGMTVRNAWGKICEIASSDKAKGPIYEEMIITENEMKTGVGETLAYEHFGERINDNSIIRFTALLSQNIRKGSTNLSLLLYEEYIRAFEQRKQDAIKKGEEAGTKLLFPMMMLLMTVTLIIIVPAFLSL